LKLKSKEDKTGGLPAAPVQEAMYFAAEEQSPTSSENTYLHEQVFNPSHSPKSPT
jgi:hypothetical protein